MCADMTVIQVKGGSRQELREQLVALAQHFAHFARDDQVAEQKGLKG